MFMFLFGIERCPCIFSRENKYQLGWNHVSEHAPRRDWARGFRPEVAKLTVSSLRYTGVTIFGVLVSVHAVSWLDNKNPELFDCFNEDLPKRHLFYQLYSAGAVVYLYFLFSSWDKFAFWVKWFYIRGVMIQWSVICWIWWLFNPKINPLAYENWLGPIV